MQALPPTLPSMAPSLVGVEGPWALLGRVPSSLNGGGVEELLEACFKF